jgi:hypothetical protein
MRLEKITYIEVKTKIKLLIFWSTKKRVTHTIYVVYN